MPALSTTTVTWALSCGAYGAGVHCITSKCEWGCNSDGTLHARGWLLINTVDPQLGVPGQVWLRGVSCKQGGLPLLGKLPNCCPALDKKSQDRCKGCPQLPPHDLLGLDNMGFLDDHTISQKINNKNLENATFSGTVQASNFCGRFQWTKEQQQKKRRR